MTSSTRNVDWSTDSKFFRSQASDYTIDMKYWESKSELTDNDDGDQFFLSRALTWKYLWNNSNSTQIGTNHDDVRWSILLRALTWNFSTGRLQLGHKSTGNKWPGIREPVKNFLADFFPTPPPTTPSHKRVMIGWKYHTQWLVMYKMSKQQPGSEGGWTRD